MAGLAVQASVLKGEGKVNLRNPELNPHCEAPSPNLRRLCREIAAWLTKPPTYRWSVPESGHLRRENRVWRIPASAVAFRMA